MSIETDCSSCGQRLRAPDTAIGKSIRCPHCQNVMDIPAAPASPSPSAIPAEAWRVRGEDGTIYGPVPTAELDVWAREGRIDAQTQLSREGTDQWVLASVVYPQLLSSSPTGYPPPTSTNPFADAGASSNPYASASTVGGQAPPRGDSGPRPLSGGVIAVAVVNLVFAALMLGCGVLLVVAGDEISREMDREIARQTHDNMRHEAAVREVAETVINVIVIISLVFGVLLLLGGIGLLKRQQWGRILTMIAASIGILLAILSIVSLAQGETGALISLAFFAGYATLVFTILLSSNVAREFKKPNRHASR